MDPSYKNSNSGDGSGGMNPNGAMQSVTPAEPVVSEQPITPVQPVAPVQPVMPGQFVASAQPPQRVNPITHRPMGPVVGGAAMNQMSGQMTSPMMNNALPNQNMMQPMSSGVGDDIVLAGAEKKKPKLSTIIIVAFAVLFAVVVLVLAITRTIGGGGGDGAENAKEAFDRYANYYLYGEDKTNDIDITYDESFESYFDRYAYDEESRSSNPNYLSNILVFFDSFYNFYGSNPNINEDLSEYKNKLELLSMYYGGAFLTEYDIAQEYNSSGEDGVKKKIQEEYEPYKEVGMVYGVNYYDLVSGEAIDELDILMEYERAGCFLDGKVDYGCVSGNGIDSLNQVLIEEVAEKDQELVNVLKRCEFDLYDGIFMIKTIIYEGAENGESV